MTAPHFDFSAAFKMLDMFDEVTIRWGEAVGDKRGDPLGEHFRVVNVVVSFHQQGKWKVFHVEGDGPTIVDAFTKAVGSIPAFWTEKK